MQDVGSSGETILAETPLGRPLPQGCRAAAPPARDSHAWLAWRGRARLTRPDLIAGRVLVAPAGEPISGEAWAGVCWSPWALSHRRLISLYVGFRIMQRDNTEEALLESENGRDSEGHRV